jgi:hypothetical protein
MKRDYIFYGINVRIDADKDLFFKIFENIFNLKPEKLPTRPRIRLIFKSKEDVAEIFQPKILDKISLIRERPVKGYYDGKRLFLTDSKSVIQIDYINDTARFDIHSSTLSFSKLFSHTLLPLALTELLKKFGFYYIHASCAEIKGKGILFLGEPGAGKTTACYSLVKAGAKWISDDAVLVKEVQGKIRSFNFIKEFGLAVKKGSLLKRDLQNSKIFRKSFRTTTVPKMAVIIERNSKASLRPFAIAEKSDLLGRIIDENKFIFINHRSSEKLVKILAKLTSQCNTLYLLDNNLALKPKSFTRALSHFF